MQRAGQIAPQPWMTAPATRAVLDALSAEGACVRFVGGCVRDAVLGRPVKDVDFATPDEPETVLRLLARAGHRALPTGLEHGTVTAVVDAARFEITTLRRDVETDGRRARVAFTDDWVTDARRRDFTINAVYCAADGTLYDPVGGLEDLRRGRVRFVGDARRRIIEDKLRLLRFFRFYAWYGRPPADPAALDACRELAPELKGLSGERVREEILAVLGAPDPAPVIAMMAEDRVLEQALPEAGDGRRLAALVTAEGLTGGADPLRRLAALLGGGSATAVAERLRLSKAQRERLRTLTDPPMAVTVDLDRRARRHALYRLGADTFRDLALLAWAGEGETRSRHETETWRALITEAETWTPPKFPLHGRDVLALGVAAGPAVGELLGRVEEWWIEGDFTADRKAALAHLRALVAKTR
ncbi:MAG: CCA tRNA nucleotidyltransferase [Kiloniellales bacterium]